MSNDPPNVECKFPEPINYWIKRIEQRVIMIRLELGISLSHSLSIDTLTLLCYKQSYSSHECDLEEAEIYVVD